MTKFGSLGSYIVFFFETITELLLQTSLVAHKYWRISLSTSSSPPLRFQSRKCVFFFSSSVKWWPKQKLFSRLLYRGTKNKIFWRGFFFLFQSDGYILFSSIFYWRWKRNFIYYFFLSGYYNVYKKKRREEVGGCYTSCPPAHRTGNRESITWNAHPTG